MKPLQKRWLRDIGKAENGRLGAHIGGSKRDLNACQGLLDAGLIKIETAFEGGLFLIAITDAGRAALATTE
jgi:hypothetical protein